VLCVWLRKVTGFKSLKRERDSQIKIFLKQHGISENGFGCHVLDSLDFLG
jgi:hypothetical protein